jgi:hypothetical protein
MGGPAHGADAALLVFPTLSRRAWGAPFMPRKPLEAFEHGGRLVKVGAKQTYREKSAPLGAPNGLARSAPYFYFVRVVQRVGGLALLVAPPTC